MYSYGWKGLGFFFKILATKCFFSACSLIMSQMLSASLYVQLKKGGWEGRMLKKGGWEGGRLV
jgi:hypothetical protein